MFNKPIAMYQKINLRRPYAVIFLACVVFLTGCDKLGFVLPWQSKPTMKIQVDGVATTGKEPMLLLSEDLEPLVDPSYKLIRRDLYACEGMVAPWFQKLLVAEFNFLAKESDLKSMENPVCLFVIEKDLEPNTGRFNVDFYENQKELQDCALHYKCKSARNVTLVLKNESFYRSYFLSDFKREKYYQHCVKPDTEWLSNTTCYTID